ncbi:MAG: ECF-type sigma factor [Planctomycetota bacterium]
MSDESVTLWIQELKDGDDLAASELWDRYFHRLVGLGRRFLRNSGKAMVDEEDLALSTFKSLCIRAKEDRFPKLDDREDLWKLLVTIALRKSYRATKKDTKTTNEDTYFHQQLASAEPSPDFVMEMDDTIESLLSRLSDERLREVALKKLQGLTNNEIAAQMDRSVSFVERKLQLIRQVWASENLR